MAGRQSTFVDGCSYASQRYANDLHRLSQVPRHSVATLAVADIMSAMRERHPSRKLWAPFHLPDELAKNAPRRLAALLYPLVNKTCRSHAAPTQWVGGDIVMRAQSYMECTASGKNRRDTLLGDHYAKSVRRRLAPTVSQAVGNS